MLSKKKIKLMFRMADYEKNEGKTDLRIIKLYKADYVRINILKTIVCITLAYVFILALVIMYNLDYLISNAVTLDYNDIAVKAVSIYIALVVFYSFISLLVFTRKYNISKKRVKKYYRYLKYLNEYYQNDNTENVEE